MKYPIAFCDYDNTIFDAASGVVPARTLQAIRDYRAAGGTFVVTTGRMYPSIKMQLARVDMDRIGHVICLQGSVGYDMVTDVEMFCHDLSREDWHAVARFAEAKGWTYQFYHGPCFYTAFANDYSAAYARYTGVAPTIVGQPLSYWDLAADWTAHKMIVMSPPDEAAARIDLLRSAFPHLDVSQSSDIYIEIVAPHSGKGNAVRAMCDLLGYTPDQALGFGDATNDVTLLTAVGCGVAVGNAYDALKQVARYVCAPCAQCGVADVLDAVRLGTMTL